MFTDNVKFFQKAIILHPKHDQLLALKRTDTDQSRPGQWDLPGGNVDFGELHLPAIEREIQEETGLTVSPLQVLEIFTRYETEAQIYIISVGYQCRAQSQMVQLSQEHSTYRWVGPNEFLAFSTPSLLKTLVEKFTTVNLAQPNR